MVRIEAISSLTMRPMGMPVQSPTTAATASESTTAKTIGSSPWAAAISASAASSASRKAASSSSAPSSRALARASVRALRLTRTPSSAAFSRSHLAVTSSSATWASWICSSSLAMRSPLLYCPSRSRSAISSSIFNSCRRRRRSSTGAGVACWETPTRAQAVSSRETALSGNWRAGT